MWMAGVGDQVEQDEEIATIETDKVVSLQVLSLPVTNTSAENRSMSP